MQMEDNSDYDQSEASEVEDYSEGGEEHPQTGIPESEGENSDNGEETPRQKKNSELKPSMLTDPRKKAEFDPLKNPPKLVLIQGPPRSGKTTLIRSLIKHYTNQNVTDPKGPITIKTSKKQRLTFLECPNDLSRTLDLAKVPDVVLTLVDTSIGFEMETFEFLSMMQIHGFPKVMAMGTHLDHYRDPEKKKKVKKALRKRFEKETSHDTRFFFMSDMSGGFYNFKEVHNLARLLSVVLPRESEFKQRHPHVLVDRFEAADIDSADTLRDDDRIDVTCFGYVRGGEYRPGRDLYMCGLGFLKSNECKEIADPVPLNLLHSDLTSKKISKAERFKVKVTVDKKDDAASEEEEGEEIEDKPAKVTKTQQLKKFSRSLKKREKLIYAPMSDLGFLIFDETGDYVNIPDKHVVFTQREGHADEFGEHEGVRMMRELQRNMETVDRQLESGDVFLFGGVKVEHEEVKQPAKLVEYKQNLAKVNQLAAQVLANSSTHTLQPKQSFLLRDLIYGEGRETASSSFDCSKFYNPQLMDRKFYRVHARHRFATGAEYESEESDYEREFVNQEEDAFENPDAALTIPKGKYIKILLKGIKFSTYRNMANSPIIISQVEQGETNRGFLLVKFRRHRWFSGLMKSMDPAVISSGFQKFQTLPYFGRKDAGDRLRMAKYTPKYEFTQMVYYGNYVPIGTGVVALKELIPDPTNPSTRPKFRISGTGVVIGFSQDYKIKKKLKLVGEPFKVFKNTAFIKNMFNSPVEVAKFIGAKVKTVSGIRGQIKKAVKEGASGSFRAAFEDKILLSDVVFCRSWYTVKLEKFYNPVSDFNPNRIILSTRLLRKKFGIEAPQNTEMPRLERPNKKFMPMIVPKTLRKELPFKTKEKYKEESIERRVKKDETVIAKAFSTDQEKQARFLIQRLKLIKSEKEKLKKETERKKRAWKEKWDEGMNKNRDLKKKKIEKEQQRKKILDRQHREKSKR